MKTGRGSYLSYYSKNIFSMILWNLPSALFSGLLLTFSVSAMFSGCTEYHDILVRTETDNETTFNINNSISTSDGVTLDIFAFEDDSMLRLDSYQRLNDFKGPVSHISSTGGNKLFFICANGQKTSYEWAEISSYKSMEKVNGDLEKENPSTPLMTGECRSKAGDIDKAITLRPLASEIVLKSISCDFSDTPYSDRQISDVKVYLINVSASCPLSCKDGFRASRVINRGQFNNSDVRNFRHPDIIVQNIQSKIDRATLYPYIRLLCYSNLIYRGEENTPDTRLVIEGKIDSKTYYWPIRINNEEASEYFGVSRGNRYIYEIHIRRKGVTDPDIPFIPQTADIKMTVRPWTEKEEYGVEF